MAVFAVIPLTRFHASCGSCRRRRRPDASLPRSERAYQQLRGAIQAGHLPPGTRLREVELAESLGLSRTPVREALSRLESEGSSSTSPIAA